jgi:hypothetical protein
MNLIMHGARAATGGWIEQHGNQVAVFFVGRIA